MEDSFEDFLNDISRCFLERNFDLWRSRVILPFCVITRKGPVILADVAALQKDFELYLKAIDRMRFDLVDRNAISFEECGDDTFLGTFQTRLVSGGILSSASYTATALLLRVEGRLRMSSMLNAKDYSDLKGYEVGWEDTP